MCIIPNTVCHKLKWYDSYDRIVKSSSIWLNLYCQPQNLTNLSDHNKSDMYWWLQTIPYIFCLLCGTEDLNKGGDLLTRSPLILWLLMSVQITTPPKRSPLLGNVDPILVCIRFGTPPLEIENQVKLPVKSWLSASDADTGDTEEQEALSHLLLSWEVEILLGWRDITGHWTKLMTWVEMKGKPNGRPEVTDLSWWFILDIYTNLTNIWEEYCSVVINNNTTK